MNILKWNKYLSVYQIIGFSLVIIILSINCIKEGGLVIYLIPMAIIAILPFLLVSIFVILPRNKNETKIKRAVSFGLIWLIVFSLFLPLFYETGGVLIALFCILMGILGYFFRKDLEKQIAIFNSVGTILLSTIILEQLTGFLGI